MRTHVPFSLLATALACSVFAAPAHALRARVFVSKAGADAGGCSFSAPCQSLDFALNGVEPGGEITILDSGGYNPITITKGVTITVPPGVEAGIAVPSGGTGITITAGLNDTVVLRGLTLEGAASGQTGIVFADGGGLEITDCTIRNFTETGIYVGVGSSPILGMNLLISNTRVLDNPTAGIDLEPQAGGAVIIAIDRVTANNNGYGIYMGATTTPPAAGATIRGTITNSVINSNVHAGIAATSAGTNSEVFVSVKDSSTSNNNYNNAGIGISVSNGNSQVVLSHSLVNYNDIGIMFNGGFVFSAGNNDMTFNGTPVSGGSLGSAPEQ